MNSLQARVALLESSNRDTISILEVKSTAYDNLAAELTNQHQKTVELRREISALEQSVQSARTESNNAKLHEQGLQQEIEHLKRNNDWLDTELKTRSGEHTKFRKEKAARIAELQRQNDDLLSNVDALTRTEKTLRSRLDEVSQKADDAFSRIQQLQEEAVRKEKAFSVELDAANRLVELLKNSANTERQRQQDLHNHLESTKENASEEIGRITAECDTEHREREAGERKIAELEIQIERLEADVAMLQDRGSARDSPAQGINGSTTPNRAGSRMVSPSPARLKGSMSVTQLYSDNNNLKAELEREKRHNEKLNATIDELMQELETTQPEVEELRTDHSRLQSDVAEMSSLVDAVGKERDQALKDARQRESQIAAKMKEGEVLRQQLRDLSSQVKVLLMEVHLRGQGLGELSSERHLQLERLAQGQINEDEMDDATDTDRFISQNLVTFKNVAELQEQNSKLVKVTRELGEKMEHEEALRKESSKAAQSREDLQQKYHRCKEEIRSLVTQSESYVRERDIFKRMLFQRGHDVNSISGESMDGELPATPSRSVLNSIERSPNSKDMADYAKLLKDMQAHFDSYRQEAATDRSTLKQQVDSLSKQNSELRGEVSRSGSQVVLAHERYEMLQANYGMLKTENAELQKRSQFYSESAAKQELRTQQVTEDLVEAKGLVDSMRNETANLKAEKEFWKGIEKRLSEDNESLLSEQKRLNTLNANLQNLLNEREHSDNEARRRLQVQIEILQRELQITKSKLTEEVEENKRAVSRREFENQQNQKRIDDLISSLGSTREELVAAKTTRGHLQTRVEELTIELRSAEERVEVLQPTQTGRSATRNDGEQSHESNAETHLSTEQELSVQVSELKRDLDLARGELENMKSQVEQYKAISQASEEELQSFNETQELYRQETDKAIKEKNARIKELEDRIADTSAELASRDSELSELRSSQAEHNRRLEEQKASFESEKAQLKEEADRQSSAAHFYQEDLKAQADIAQQAQQNYENELVKHAEAAKSLQKVRSDYSQLRIEVVELKTEAESTRTNLTQNEENWKESKARYEREIADLKAAREGLIAQNNRLLQQLDEVSSQIAKLKKRQDTEEGERPASEERADASPSPSLENMQEVIRYLRREKEIIEVQYSLSETEGKRLKQQLDYTQSQLDETRLRLNQQRRLEQDSERTSLNHNKLMETINELSTFRESNVTLRNETRQAQASLALKSQRVEELLAQVEPLQAEVQELRSQIETQAGEATLLREDRERWQQRAQDILQKYDRIDPAEMEALKNKIQMLETERDEITSSKASLQEQYNGIAGQVVQAQEQGNERVTELRQKLTEQFKARSKQQSERIAEKDTALQAALKEKQDLEQQLANLQQELGAAQAEKDELVANTANGNGQSEIEEGQVDDNASPKAANEDLQALQGQLLTAEAKANEEISRSSSLQEQITTSQARVAELEAQVVSSQALEECTHVADIDLQAQMQQTVDEANIKFAHLQDQQQQQSTSPSTASAEQIEQLRQDLAEAQQDAETLRATASVNESLGNISAENGEKSISAQLTERVEEIRAELESRHNDRVTQLEEAFKKRVEGMRTQLSTKLAEGKEKAKQSLAAEHEQAIQTLKSTHEQDLESLRVRHQDELAELKQHEEARFSQFKEAWISEHSASSINDSAVKTEVQAAKSVGEITEAEARILVQTNSFVRGVLRSNVDKKVNEAREAVALQLKEEHEKELVDKLAEAQSKASTAKEHAVSMEQKRNQIKVSMSDNKAKIALAKLSVVQTAANETPQKPVVEVWDVAKNTKPEVAAAPPSATAGSTPGQQPASASAIEQPAAASAQNTHDQGQKPTPTFPFGQPSAVAQGAQAQSQKPPTSSFGQPFGLAQGTQAQGQKPPTSSFGQPSGFGQPTSFGQPSKFFQNNQAQGQKPAPTTSFGQPSLALDYQAQMPKIPVSPQQSTAQEQQQPTTPQGPAQQRPSNNSPNRAPASQPSPNQASHAASQQDQRPVNGTQQPPRQPPSQPGGNIPQKSQGQNNPFAQGSGAAAARSLQQSGLPVAARGGSNRGAGNQRGRGQGRGGGQSVDTNRVQGQQQGRASPTSANLNPGARQFVPGNKRPRDDGQEGQHGDGVGNGKRIRGGGGGPWLGLRSSHVLYSFQVAVLLLVQHGACVGKMCCMLASAFQDCIQGLVCFMDSPCATSCNNDLQTDY